MPIELTTPTPPELPQAVEALRDWQHDEAPMQLHPGDIGWFGRFGEEATAAAVRIWRRNNRILAVGLLDEPTLLRMTMAPDAYQDEELAHTIADALPAGKVSIEAPKPALLQQLLPAQGWQTDDPWTPLRRDLTQKVEDPNVRIETAGPEQAEVVRASFERSTFTPERWHAMAQGAPYHRCLMAYDGTTPVATVTVWSAGEGRPGLLEPMGVHREHRGRGYGRAITLAAAKALQGMGSSSALVCTPSANVGAVATYLSGGFAAREQVRDLVRTS